MKCLGLAGVALALAAGCSGPEKKPPEIPKGLGQLVLDVRRDGGKFAFGYSYVLRPAAGGGAGQDGPYVNPYVQREQVPPAFQLSPGRYAVDVFGVGACARAEDIEVVEGKQTLYKLNMEPGGSVEGIVLGPASGEPLAGVQVWRPLDRGYGQSTNDWKPMESVENARAVKTNDNGFFVLPNLPPGEHVIVFFNPEIGWLEKKVTVVDGKRLQLKPITLERTATNSDPK
jgi:hypothetical protein